MRAGNGRKDILLSIINMYRGKFKKEKVKNELKLARNVKDKKEFYKCQWKSNIKETMGPRLDRSVNRNCKEGRASVLLYFH